MDGANILLPVAAEVVIKRLYESGHEAFAVGGCVRDSIMGRKPNDWDVTTSARPEETLSVFSVAPFKAVPTGIAHGTITVVYDGEPIEVTTYRVDGEYSDCRHPDSVNFTSKLSEDLKRRDFTVNAMAYSERDGIVDLFGGRDDIENRLIRCVGEPEKRFSEDALRIMRALRFASVLGFGIEESTAAAIFELSPLLDHVSRERIYSELTKLITGKNAPEVIRNYREVLSVVTPVCDCADVIERLDEVGQRGNIPLLYAALLYGSDAESALRLLRAEKKTITRVCAILAHPFAVDYIGAKRLCSVCGVDIARDIELLAFARGEIGYEGVEFIDTIVGRDECVSIKQLKIGGGELRGMGIEPVRIGDALSGLLGEVIDGRIPNERSSLASFAAKNYL